MIAKAGRPAILGWHDACRSVRNRRLVVIEPHPVQYHAPVYREIHSKFNVPVTVVYGSDCSVAGYRDAEFGASFYWDTDLLSGYEPIFLTCSPQHAHLESAGSIRRALQQLDPAAVLLLGYSPRFHQRAFWECWRARVPILFRGETTDHARTRGSLHNSLRSNALRLLYRTCSKLLYVGEHSLRHFSRLGVPRSKLAFSPYCVDTKPFRISDRDRAELRNTMRARLNLAPDDVMLLFSGKLSYRKGPDLLLKAAKALPQQTRRRIVAGFLGSGDMQPELAALAQRQPSIPVHFFGFQNQTQLSAYYHAADLLVLPSRHSETWGLVVNEALHHGLPAIVSEAVGCAPDLIVPGRTGELFETNSVQSLTEAILRGLPLAIDPCVRSNCREKIAAYTVEKAAEGIASAFWSVVQPDHIEDPCPVLN